MNRTMTVITSNIVDDDIDDVDDEDAVPSHIHSAVRNNLTLRLTF